MLTPTPWLRSICRRLSAALCAGLAITVDLRGISWEEQELEAQLGWGRD